MAYDEYLEERISQFFDSRNAPFIAKKMMGGLCFMVDDKMCCGIVNNQLMARIDPEIYQECLEMEGVNDMNFTGRPMKGYLFIDPDAIDEDEQLDYWLDKCLEFNPKAKSSKRS